MFKFRSWFCYGSVAASLAATLVLVGFVACKQSGTIAAATSSDTDASTIYNRHAIDSAVSLLNSGDVLLRMGMGVHSYILSHLNRKDKRYSHCGIVRIENGYPFVYHALGGEDNPDARLRRDSACRFLNPNQNSAFAIVRYDLDSSQVVALSDSVIAVYKARPHFDLAFDLSTDTALYCTEFAYKVINSATNDSSFIPCSHAGDRAFVGTDNLYLNKHARFIWQERFK